MLQTKLFTRTKKEAPSDEVSKNAKLLIKAGFIHKEMAGVYSFLPLGLKVLKKIENIIREEMNAIGGQEVSMSVLQDKNLWEKTDRWEDQKVDAWFKTKLKSGTELGLGFTHEEPLTVIMKSFISSYRDLPKYVYQFQNKFRNETRAKSGLLRGREFLMKDLYSFHESEDDMLNYYDKTKDAYFKIFNRCGLDAIYTKAAGGAFTASYTHEFQVVAPVGEDTIFVCDQCRYAENKEISNLKEGDSCPLCKGKIKKEKSIEVGNIFPLGTKYSEPIGLTYKAEGGEERGVVMGSYGIGLPRLMATVVEVFSDERGIVWPESIAPFSIHVLVLGEDGEVFKKADKIYEDLQNKGIEVLYDDRHDISAGEKFADADLIGLPYRVVISERSLKEGGVEIKKRTEEKGKIINVDELMNLLVPRT